MICCCSRRRRELLLENGRFSLFRCALWPIVALASMLFLPAESTFMSQEARTTVHQRRKALLSSPLSEDDLSCRLQRARMLLEKSKAKLAQRLNHVAKNDQLSNNEGRDDGSGGTTPDGVARRPFFASVVSEAAKRTSIDKRNIVIKSRDEQTGLITTDGEKMAALSEEEAWETRSLLEVFENEMLENQDVYSLASKQLAERDVAASIQDLRKSLQGEDYRKIFDKNNRFIGEDD